MARSSRNLACRAACRRAPARATTAGLLAALAAGAAPLAHPQEVARTSLRGSLTALGAYDDNIYFTREDRQRGAVIRFRPMLSAEHQVSPVLSFSALCTTGAEVYPERSELNSAFASRSASLEGRYRVGPATSVVMGGHYSASSRAAELIPDAGLEFGLLSGRSWGLNAAGSRRIGPGGSLGLAYAFAHLEWLARMTDHIPDTRQTRRSKVMKNFTSAAMSAGLLIAFAVSSAFADGPPPVSVPEPGTLELLGLGTVCLALYKKLLRK